MLDDISVLSVEPYGMKPAPAPPAHPHHPHFSALGRAVWDETHDCLCRLEPDGRISVLSVEPYGMKLKVHGICWRMIHCYFSALGRAVWDET